MVTIDLRAIFNEHEYRPPFSIGEQGQRSNGKMACGGYCRTNMLYKCYLRYFIWKEILNGGKCVKHRHRDDNLFSYRHVHIHNLHTYVHSLHS
jgi:hypothetical protein